MERVVLHADANSYYASVEVLHNPSLRGKTVAVGGDVEARHGIILAKSPECKPYKIKTGEAIWEAKEKCPGLIVVPPHYDLYERFTREIHEIFRRYTDRVEPFGSDEGWLDVTDSQSLFGDGETIAYDLKETVKRELGLTLSVGVSYNKIFSKLGSDLKKPDAVSVISKENYKQVAWPLPVEEMLYVGRSTQIKLNARSVLTIGQLANTPPEYLRSWFGKIGEVLYCFANGIDLSPVATVGDEALIKSIGNSITTASDINGPEDASVVYYSLSESVAARLREQGLKGTTIQISVRGGDLTGFVRQTQIKKPTYLSNEIHDAAMRLLRANYNFRAPLRSIGVRAMNLVPESAATQLDFFEPEEERIRRETLEKTIDMIRYRFGHDAIDRAVKKTNPKLGLYDIKTDHQNHHPVGYFKG